MEGDRKFDDYNDGNLGELGYQTQEFDAESGELVSAEEDMEEFDDESFDADDEEFQNRRECRKCQKQRMKYISP